MSKFDEILNSSDASDALLGEQIDKINVFLNQSVSARVLVNTNGSWSGTNLIDMSTRIRPSHFIEVKRGDTIKIKNGTLKFALCVWNRETGGVDYNTSWVSSNSEYVIKGDGYFIIQFAKTTDTQAISPSEYTGEVIVETKLINLQGMVIDI